MPSYPHMNDTKLLPFKQIAQALQDDPTYLDQSDCPYPPHIRDWLKGKFAPAGGAAPVDEAAGDDLELMAVETWKDIARKANRLYSELERLANSNNEVSENIQIIKSKAGLLERLVVVGDKSLGLAQSAEFRRVLLSIFEDILTPDQRTTAMARMESFL